MSRSFLIIVSVLVELLAILCVELVRELRLEKQAVGEKEREIDALRAELQNSANQVAIIERTNASNAEELVELRRRSSKLEQEAGQSTNEAAKVREQLALLQKQITVEAREPQNAPGDRAKGGGPGAQNNSSELSEREILEANFCRNHLAQIGRAVQRWAEGHDNHAPSNLLELKEYLAPMILVCPSANPKSLALSWNEFNPADVTYKVVSPGITWFPGISSIFAGCRIHQHINLLSGAPEGVVSTPVKYVPPGRIFVPNTRSD